MIQRKQSLYLLAIALLSIWMAFGNIAYVSMAGLTEGAKGSVIVEYDESIITAGEGTLDMTNLFLAIPLIILALFCIVTIFIFKKRSLQMMLARVNFVLIAMILYFMYHYSYGIGYFEPITSVSFEVGVGLPIAIIIFNWLAIRGINKDENLIRSMDRIR